MHCVLLLILLHCCKLNAQDNVFTINSVALRADPSEQVNNGESVTLKCSADISKREQFQLNYTFSFFKDGKALVNNTLQQELAEYTITKARFSDSGMYECALNVEGKKKVSKSLTVKVKGIMKPVLTVQKTEVTEGETVSLCCKVLEEEPPFYFTFYKTRQTPPGVTQEWHRQEIKENFAKLEYPIDAGDTILFFGCKVQINSAIGSEMSELSDRTIVTVVEPFSIPNITIHPPQNITEGDNMRVECTTVLRHHQDQTEIIIQKNKVILNSTKSRQSVKYSKVATVEDNGNYTCKVELGSVSKISTVNVVVAELFSKPMLVHHKRNWDENSFLRIVCRVDSSLPIHFSVMKDNRLMANNSVYNVTKVRVADTGSYVCRAEIKGIVKESDPVQLNVFAPVSQPVLSQSSSQVVVGKLFSLHCYSSRGTLPILYTLYRGGKPINSTAVTVNRSAEFWVNATNVHAPGDYACSAENGHSVPQQSTGLNITVIVPVGNINMTRLPNEDVEDGTDLTLFCTVGSGSYPIEFNFFRENNPKSLHKVTEKKKRTAVWHRVGLTSQDGGKYFCRADNQAKSHIDSNMMIVRVVLASWKKWLIAIIIVLILLGVTIAASWWYFRKKAKVFSPYEGKGSPMELTSSTAATNSMGEKLTSQQNNEGDFYYGSVYNENGENNHIKSKEDNQGPDLENSEVEYTEVEVSVPDPYRAPITEKTETVYTEIRKASNDAGGNRHSVTNRKFT
ncbi:platelet endothelial cell adhesion molecule isoform X3 [Rhineura floridana]|uniref:platelet endothelial cell adhesion molecule isoform X3 n=1 Tax=Rhineura floridana TaxID=261503 RepID=UPI002AC7FE63|nr:platelet endothelial cell adhesion molecule isoform X3 [Rhineura floridana]